MLTHWKYFTYIYPRTERLYLHIFLNFYALLFTYVVLYTWTTFWYTENMNWFAYVSIIVGLLNFFVFIGLMVWLCVHKGF